MTNFWENDPIVGQNDQTTTQQPQQWWANDPVVSAKPTPALEPVKQAPARNTEKQLTAANQDTPKQKPTDQTPPEDGPSFLGELGNMWGAVREGTGSTIAGYGNSLDAATDNNSIGGAIASGIESAGNWIRPEDYQAASDKFQWLHPSTWGYAPRAAMEGLPGAITDAGAFVGGTATTMNPFAGAAAAAANHGARTYGDNLEQRMAGEGKTMDQATGKDYLWSGIGTAGESALSAIPVGRAVGAGAMMKGIGGAIKEGVKQAGVDAATSMAGNIANQTGRNAQTGRSFSIDPNEVLNSGALGVATGAMTGAGRYAHGAVKGTLETPVPKDVATSVDIAALKAQKDVAYQNLEKSGVTFSQSEITPIYNEWSSEVAKRYLPSDAKTNSLRDDFKYLAEDKNGVSLDRLEKFRQDVQRQAGKEESAMIALKRIDELVASKSGAGELVATARNLYSRYTKARDLVENIQKRRLMDSKNPERDALRKMATAKSSRFLSDAEKAIIQNALDQSKASRIAQSLGNAAAPMQKYSRLLGIGAMPFAPHIAGPALGLMEGANIIGDMARKSSQRKAAKAAYDLLQSYAKQQSGLTPPAQPKMQPIIQQQQQPPANPVSQPQQQEMSTVLSDEIKAKMSASRARSALDQILRDIQSKRK